MGKCALRSKQGSGCNKCTGPKDIVLFRFDCFKILRMNPQVPGRGAGEGRRQLTGVPGQHIK